MRIRCQISVKLWRVPWESTVRIRSRSVLAIIQRHLELMYSRADRIPGSLQSMVVCEVIHISKYIRDVLVRAG
jgi:hypothetical protein